MRWPVTLGILLGFVLGVATGVKLAEAHHNNPPVLTNQLIGVYKAINDRGFGKYAVGCDGNTYPKFREQLAEVMSDEVTQVGIPWIEVGLNDNPDVVHCLTYNYPCVAGSAGCVLGLWGPPAMVYYQEALLYGNWRTTQGHEHGHAGDDQHEMYDDRNFACLPDRVWTRMSCGTGTWWVTPFDKEVTWEVYVPDAPCPRGFSVKDGWATVSWGAQRCDGGAGHHGNPLNDNATAVEFGWLPPGASEIISSHDICGIAFNYCSTPYATGQRAFDSFWRGCLYVRSVNPALWWAPQASAPDFWTWVGCW